VDLDGLYGAGTWKSLLSTMSLVRENGVPVQTDPGDGTVHVEFHWSDDVLRVDFKGDTLHVSYLSTMCAARPEQRAPDLSLGLHEHVVPWLKTIGVTVITARPISSETSEMIVSTGGYGVGPDRHLTWKI
jgi:hypothetical protein